MTNPNDPAFPNKDHMGDGPNGLTKLEWYSGEAMKGLRSAALHDQISGTEHGRKLWSSFTIAQQAVHDAQALIAELNKKQKEPQP